MPVMIRSSDPVATSQVSHAGRPMRGASATRVPTPEALSFAPGPRAESVWAITIRRQLRRPSAAPITLRERPRPGTRKPWVEVRRPASRKARAT